MNERDLPLLRAIAQLKGNANFDKFTGWLEQLLNRDRARLMVEEGVQLHRAQGSAVTLKLIVETVAEAETIVRAIEDARAKNCRPGAVF